MYGIYFRAAAGLSRGELTQNRFIQLPLPGNILMNERNSPFDIEVYGPSRDDWRQVLRKPVATRDSLGDRPGHGLISDYPPSIPVRDERRAAPSSPTTDRVLEAVPPGKVCSLGRVWTGSLKPLLNSHVESVRSLVSGFTLGQTLTPEPPTPRGEELSMGRTWGNTRAYVARVADAMGSQICDRATREGDAESDDPVDLSRVMDALRELKAQARDGHPNAVGAAIAALSGAIADVKPERRAATGAPLQFSDQGGREAPQGALSANIRAFRQGRTIDGRPRSKMQLANEERRRKLAAERREVQGDDWPPEAA